MPSDKKDRRRTYRERKEQGNCPRCGRKKRKAEKTIYCEDCRAYFRDYVADNSEVISSSRQAIYNERKANGQCPCCGKKLGVRYNKIICRKCLDKRLYI